MAGCTPTLLKVDVEDHDAEVMAGASATLGHTTALLVELGDPATSDGLMKAGFTPCTHDGRTRILTAHDRAQANEVGYAGFVRDKA